MIDPCHLLPDGTIVTMSSVTVCSSHGAVVSPSSCTYRELITHEDSEELQSRLKVQVQMTPYGTFTASSAMDSLGYVS